MKKQILLVGVVLTPILSTPIQILSAESQVQLNQKTIINDIAQLEKYIVVENNPPETMEKMGMRYPPSLEGIEDIVIEWFAVQSQNTRLRWRYLSRVFFSELLWKSDRGLMLI